VIRPRVRLHGNQSDPPRNRSQNSRLENRASSKFVTIKIGKKRGERLMKTGSDDGTKEKTTRWQSGQSLGSERVRIREVSKNAI